MNSNLRHQSVPLKEYLHRKASRFLIPLSGTFELTPVCNLSCKMCYIRKTARQVKESPRPQMTLEQWRAIARQARESGTLYLLLTGGEPFLWPDFWTLYEELVQMGFLVSINTNGTMIDEEAVGRLKKLPPHRINITLYGASDETYDALCGAKGMFRRVDSAISALRAAGIPVRLNGSFTPYNVGDMERIVAYTQERGLVLRSTTYMFPPIRREPGMVGFNDRFTPEESARYRMRSFELQTTPEQYRQYLQNIVNGSAEPPSLDESCTDPLDGKIRCRAGKASFWITWDGWLTPCGLMPQPGVDLTEQSFTEGWQILTWKSARVRLSGICGSCANQGICNPCAAMAIAETGNPGGIPQYVCRVAQEMRSIAQRSLSEAPDVI